MSRVCFITTLIMLMSFGICFAIDYPDVPEGVEGTLVSRQRGSQNATFYVWSEESSLYVHIEPDPSTNFSMSFWAFDIFSVIQYGTMHDQIYIYDNLGRSYGDYDWGEPYDDEINIYAPQTFEMKDATGWEYDSFNASEPLTVGLQVQNGDSHSWYVEPYIDPADTDNDGLPDAWETEYFKNISVTDGTGDYDQDGLTEHEEYELDTDPTKSDTDGDGFSDGYEIGDPLDRGIYPKNEECEPRTVVIPMG